MNPEHVPRPMGDSGLPSRRSAIKSTLAAAGGALAITTGTRGQEPAERKGPDDRRASPKRYDKMKKSINLWAFPYPDRMNAAGVSPTRQGRRIRRDRIELRS